MSVPVAAVKLSHSMVVATGQVRANVSEPPTVVVKVASKGAPLPSSIHSPLTVVPVSSMVTSRVCEPVLPPPA